MLEQCEQKAFTTMKKNQ